MVCKLYVHCATRGKVGCVNEDNFIADRYIPGCSRTPFFSSYFECDLRENMLFAVSDGAGGGYNGSEASKITIDTIAENLNSLNTGEVGVALRNTLNTANSNVVSYYEQKQKQGAATLSGIVLEPNMAWIFNIGDSPIYSLDGGKLQKLSTEHTLAASGYGSDSVAHNTLTHFMGHAGASGAEMVCSSVMPINSPITFVIASDGVQKGISDRKLAKMISKKDKTIAEDIVNLAYKRGSKDDITIIVIKVIPQITEDD